MQTCALESREQKIIKFCFQTFSVRTLICFSPLRSQVLLRWDREVQVRFRHMVRGSYSEDPPVTSRRLSFCFVLFFLPPRLPQLPNACYTCWQPPPPTDASRPQRCNRLARLQQQGGSQCVIRAVQLCHQLLTWLSSSWTPNPSALWRSNAASVTSTKNPLTFNHGAVLQRKALAVREGGAIPPSLESHGLAMTELNSTYVVFFLKSCNSRCPCICFHFCNSCFI